MNWKEEYKKLMKFEETGITKDVYSNLDKNSLDKLYLLYSKEHNKINRLSLQISKELYDLNKKKELLSRELGLMKRKLK